jgi:hypothetical protein
MTSFRLLSNLSALMALLVVMALSGCSKEEGFAPCAKNSDESVGNEKRGSVGNEIDFNDARSKPGSTRGTSDGSSISDDGDDVGDGERNRKKKPTS